MTSKNPRQGTVPVSPVPRANCSARTRVNDAFWVEAWGVDTVSFALRSARPEVAEAIRRASERRAVCHPAVAGHEDAVTVYRSGTWNADCTFARVMGYPHGLAAVEGRLTALIRRNEAARELAHPRLLGIAAARSELLVGDLLGLDKLEPCAWVSRLDLATDVRFADPARGREFLSAMAHLPLPRYRPVPHASSEPGVLEGVEWKTKGNKTHLRIYDKGVEQAEKRGGGEAPGNLIRIEREVRLGTAKQLRPREIASADLRALFLGHSGH